MRKPPPDRASEPDTVRTRPVARWRGPGPGRIAGWAAIVLVVGVIALFTPARSVRYIVVLWLAIPLLSWLYSRLCVLPLTVRRAADVLRGQKRETIRIELTVENGSVLPLPYVWVQDTIGPLTYRSPGRFVVPLGSWDSRKLGYDVMGQKIGAYRVGPVEVGGYDPLGLFPWRRVYPAFCRLIVHPNVHRVVLTHPRGMPAGELPSPNRIYEDVTQFRSLREYTVGDEIRRINWKATARMGKLFSTEFQPTLYYPVLVLLNLSQEDYPLRFREQHVDRACEAAASLVSYMARLGQEVGLATTGPVGDGGTVSEIRGGYGHALGLLETIACTPLAAGNADYGLLLRRAHPPLGSRVMVVGPPPNHEQSESLRVEKRAGGTIECFQILPSDAPWPAADIKSYRVMEYGEELLHD